MIKLLYTGMQRLSPIVYNFGNKCSKEVKSWLRFSLYFHYTEVFSVMLPNETDLFILGDLR